MSDQHIQRAASLEARLTEVKMEIDDDDEDVVLAIVNLTNEAAIPMGGLEINITTSDGQEVSAKEGITSLGPGVTRTFTFEFPLDNGQWTFSTTNGGKKITLGPYNADFTYQEDEGRKLNNAIGSNLFHGAFTEHLSDFGNTEEKEIIDSSTVVLTTYHGENAQGGATKINVGIAEEDEEEEEEEGDSPRRPPWENSSTEETAPEPLSTPLNQSANELRTPPWENSEVVAEETTSAPVDLLSIAATTTVATETEIAPVQDSPAPTGPPAIPSSPAPTGPPAVPSSPAPTGPPAVPSTPAPEPPSSPPSSPPSDPPSESPAGPPSGPPSDPPSESPAGPPSGPPSNSPAGPPSGPPSSPPAGPPSGPPSSPPAGPPSGPPSSPPAGPPSGPPSSPPAGPPSSPPAGPPSSPPARPSDM